jgi:hypothetical protein
MLWYQNAPNNFIFYFYFYFYYTTKNDMQFGIMTKEGLYFGFDIN